MALWQPSNSGLIDPKERIGRRLFERQKLMGAKDQKQFKNTFDITHFEEYRGGGDVSLDRLGKSGCVDKRVRCYVEKRAVAAASTFSPIKNFTGWAVVNAEKFYILGKTQGPPLKVEAEPLISATNNEDDDEDLSANRYHAHVKMPLNYTAYEMSLHLKAIFDRNYHFEPSLTEQKSVMNMRLLTTSLRAWISKLYK